jgi:hypothetical protein
VVRGDAATDTARLLARLPGDEPIVVFTATLLSYLEPGPRVAFADQLSQASRRRRVAWVFAEAAGLVAATGVSAPGLPALAGNTTEYLVGASLRDPAGSQEDVLLGVADPYLRWLAPFPSS